jgi:LuxR family maltose regulon positive regulatory protein
MTLLRADLEVQLGEAAFTIAWERGGKLDVEQVARDLLREFGSAGADPIARANQLLPDPLTSRELDVLALLADSLTNPQIAERLFITTGTVKGHVNKILHKLDVPDRQQAVMHARSLHLLNL